MNDEQAYEAVLEQVAAMGDDEVRPSGVPVDALVDEALRLHDWAARDLEALTRAGMPMGYYEDLPLRAAALRHAESLWADERMISKEARRQWNEESKQARDLRDSLVHTFRFAFRRREDLKQMVDRIVAHRSDANMLQDLKDLVVAGRSNEALLAEVDFNMVQLARCEYLAEELGRIDAGARNDRAAFRDAELMRDRISVLLKESMDEVRFFGQYVFWRDGHRKSGYVSHDHREERKAVPTQNAPPPDIAPELEAGPQDAPQTLEAGVESRARRARNM